MGWSTKSWSLCPRPRRCGLPSEPPRRGHAAVTQVGALAVALAATVLLISGCETPGPREAERELQLAREAIEAQKDQLAAQRATIDALQRQVDTIRHIRPDDLAMIFYPEKLEIEGLSGGFDADGRPGDDGITVYLRPIDGEGDVLKVAGEIHIQLYDLAPPGKLIGEYTVPVDEARKLWYGKLMTYHYTVKCPWQHGPPEHPEITIRATFIDYLTQRVISAQKTCTIALPP